MKRRTLQRWILWLLPLMLLRSFVPAGFMLAANAGELSLVFCSSVSATLSSSADGQSNSAHQDHNEHHAGHAVAQSTDHHAHHGSQTNAPEHTASATNPCPFALTAIAPAPEIDFFVGELATVSYSLPYSAVLFPSPGPQRAESIRAPPAFI